MNVYLVFAPNGDIYHRTEEFLMDDIQDHMDQGECTIKCWRHDVALDDHEAPLWGLTGNKAIQEWIEERTSK